MRPVHQILIVDADATQRRALAQSLAPYHEFALAEAGSAHEALALAQRSFPDAILLDMTLPDMDGREACRMFRRERVPCPIVALGPSGDSETILALDAGANDYVARPFRSNVLLARLRAHLRQHQQSESAPIMLHHLVFQRGAKLLIDPRSGRKIRLTEKEAAIIRYLHRAGGNLVRRETLLAEVWGYNAAVSTHTIETHVYRLRRKLERDPRRAEILVSEAGGYRLVTSPQRIAA
jgi:DNA-binding response OmpR family regulator